MEKMKGYCIDTDALIDYLRGFKDARSFLVRAGKEAPLYISAISVAEIYSGKETLIREKKERIDAFLKNFVVIELTFTIAEQAGCLRRDYQRPFADMIVAASAMELGLSLVTKNVKHFRGIANLKVKVPY